MLTVDLPYSPSLPLPAGATSAFSGPSRRSPSGRSIAFVFPDRSVACTFARQWAARGVRPSLRRFESLGWEVALPVSAGGVPWR
jgi:hypothetical protein